jgi:peroxiredoxin Q/BCP
MISIGEKAPDFTLTGDDGNEWRLSDQIGNVVVLLFYPGNETLVCTRQLCSIRDNWASYLETKAFIVGISPADPTEHKRFAESRSLPLTLLADPARKVTSLYAKHALLPVSFTRGVVIVDAKGIVRMRDIMLRAFRPKDDELITEIYSARGDVLYDKYDKLRNRLQPDRR